MVTEIHGSAARTAATKRRRSEGVPSRLNIPISDSTLVALRQIARQRRVTMAELGRGIIESYLTEMGRRERLAQLRQTVLKHAGILDKTAEEWRSTEADDWS